MNSGEQINGKEIALGRHHIVQQVSEPTTATNLLMFAVQWLKRLQ